MADDDIDDLDYSYEALSELTNDELIELVQKLRNRTDELQGIRRNEQGEEIAGEDEVVQNEEVAL